WAVGGTTTSARYRRMGQGAGSWPRISSGDEEQDRNRGRGGRGLGGAVGVRIAGERPDDDRPVGAAGVNPAGAEGIPRRAPRGDADARDRRAQRDGDRPGPLGPDPDPGPGGRDRAPPDVRPARHRRGPHRAAAAPLPHGGEGAGTLGRERIGPAGG